MTNIFIATLSALKLPLKLLKGWVRKRRKNNKTELEQKQLKHVRNFAPRHYSWQQSLGRPSKKSNKKKTKTPLLGSVIQCLVCGGTMKKKQLGYDCLNCENFLSNREIKTKK